MACITKLRSPLQLPLSSPVQLLRCRPLVPSLLTIKLPTGTPWPSSPAPGAATRTAMPPWSFASSPPMPRSPPLQLTLLYAKVSNLFPSSFAHRVKSRNTQTRSLRLPVQSRSPSIRRVPHLGMLPPTSRGNDGTWSSAIGPLPMQPPLMVHLQVDDNMLWTPPIAPHFKLFPLPDPLRRERNIKHPANILGPTLPNPHSPDLKQGPNPLSMAPLQDLYADGPTTLPTIPSYPLRKLAKRILLYLRPTLPQSLTTLPTPLTVWCPPPFPMGTPAVTTPRPLPI